MMFDLAAIYFGVFLGVFPLTMMKIIRQTRKIIAQSRTYHNLYLYMIWIEALVNFIFAVVTYLYLTQIIPGSLSFYIGTGMSSSPAAGLTMVNLPFLLQLYSGPRRPSYSPKSLPTESP